VAASSNPFGLPNYPITLTVNGQTAKEWYFYWQRLGQFAASGITATVVTAKLTSGGANGSMTFTGGVLTAQTAAT
jgi:hypothetical protein